MESGLIPDSNTTASSTLNSGTPAKNGRLNFAAGSSWCAATGVSNPYLQIDLQTLHFICAVSTQGNSQADEWVETYTLQTSNDGTTWTDYTDDAGQVKVTYFTLLAKLSFSFYHTVASIYSSCSLLLLKTLTETPHSCNKLTFNC